MVERLGLKIGILGFTTTDTEKMSFPENIKNVKFLSEKETIDKYVKILRKSGESGYSYCFGTCRTSL